MAFNPNATKDILHLREMILRHREALLVYRNKRFRAIQLIVGKHYGQYGTRDKQPVNLLELMKLIFEMHLVPSDPRVGVTAPNAPQLKPDAANFEVKLNQDILDIKLGDTLREAAGEAIVAPLAIVKVGLEDIGTETLQGFTVHMSRPFVELVDFDDFVCDMGARRFRDVSYIGNKYRVPYDVARHDPNYDRRAREMLRPTGWASTTHEGGEESVREIGAGQRLHEDDELEPSVNLWDQWIPSTNQLITMEVDGGPRPLRVLDWDGPDGGPYHRLWFERVPGNLMPLSVVATGRDLHELVNHLYVKVNRQAEREKSIGIVPSGAEPDAKKIMDASDGDVVSVSTGAFNEQRFGGPDQATTIYAMQAREEFSRLMGNLDALGGLSPQSETLGQDELLHQSSAKRMAMMQGRMLGFTRGICEHLAWYIWTDDTRQEWLTRRVPGTNVDVQFEWSAETRKGDYLDYNFRIEPYSMQYRSPSQKLSALLGVFERVVAPYALQLEQQGIAINFEALLREIAKQADLPELNDILMFAGDAGQVAGPVHGSAPSGSPAVKRSINERVNTPGATPQGQNQILTQLMAGQRLQTGQAASLGRATG
jgi:hypothetical protein